MIEDIEDAITLSMQEASMKAEIEANERRLKWARGMIENQEVREEASKRSKEVARHQAEILELGGNPAGYYDDDDDDEWYQDDECYPDDE